MVDEHEALVGRLRAIQGAVGKVERGLSNKPDEFGMASSGAIMARGGLGSVFVVEPAAVYRFEELKGVGVGSKELHNLV
jgi:hypothetical protein